MSGARRNRPTLASDEKIRKTHDGMKILLRIKNEIKNVKKTDFNVQDINNGRRYYFPYTLPIHH